MASAKQSVDWSASVWAPPNSAPCPAKPHMVTANLWSGYLATPCSLSKLCCCPPCAAHWQPCVLALLFPLAHQKSKSNLSKPAEIGRDRRSSWKLRRTQNQGRGPNRALAPSGGKKGRREGEQGTQQAPNTQWALKCLAPTLHRVLERAGKPSVDTPRAFMGVAGFWVVY